MSPDGLAMAYLAISAASWLAVAMDLLRRPQRMWIMNVVWPVTALYVGPLALGAYGLIGRGGGHQRRRPVWQQAALGTTHCGAGCTLGDIAGEWLVFGGGWALAGEALWADFAVDFVLAFLLGIVFQYLSIAPIRRLGVRDGLVAALKADTISLAAFEVGLFGWMALTHFLLLPGATPADWTYWFMMQAGMVVDFATSYPANWLLIRRGIKEAM